MSINLKDNFPENIFVIGCGGTGARVVEGLKYFILEAKAKNLINSLIDVTVTLVDFDFVEIKNLARQPFKFLDVGEPKATVLQEEFGDYINIKTFPEPVNSASLPLIFNPAVLNRNFAVLSCVDNLITSSQIYFYLLRNAINPDVCWSWFYGGGEIRQGVVKGELRELEESFDFSYITTYSYGKFNGTPLSLIEPHNYIQGINDPGDVFGRTAGGAGCGMGEGQDVQQTATMNRETALMMQRMLDALYLKGYVINQSVASYDRIEIALPVSLNELLYPEDYPLYAQFINQEEGEVAEITINEEE